MKNKELEAVCTSTVQSQIIISPLGLRGGLRNMDKQSDQMQPLKKKGVQSEGKKGEERGEKRQEREGCGLEKLWSIVSLLL